MRIRDLSPLLLALAVACGGSEMEQDATAEAEQQYAAEETAAEGAADAEAAVAAVSEYWETHYNMGHGSMVASKLVDDALTWWAGGTMLFGKDAIEASLNEEIEAASPQVQIEQDEAMVFGNFAVARGTYSVETTMEGETTTNTGYWTSLNENVDGEWMIHGVISNFDSADQTPPPGESMALPPADEGAQLLEERATYYETHFNAGHPDMVADTYTEDAVVMGAGEAAIQGRDAILQRLTEMTEAGAQVSIEPWAARELDADHVAGIGTFTLETADGTAPGHWAAVYRRGADGTLRVHWLLTSEHQSGM